MKEPKEEAAIIIEMFYRVLNTIKLGDSPLAMDMSIKCAILHVNGIIEALEFHTWQNRLIIKHYKEVKQILENK